MSHLLLRRSSPRPTLSTTTTTAKANLTPLQTPTTPLFNNHRHQQTRTATLLRRPKRPYTFTQLVTLSDGSTYTHRTTTPFPVHRSSKDTRNSPLWNPSSVKLLSAEVDEAGKLRAFRERFGRGWDARVSSPMGERGGEEGEEEGGGGGDGVKGGMVEKEEEEDNLMDLISGFAAEGGEVGGKKKGGSKGGGK